MTHLFARPRRATASDIPAIVRVVNRAYEVEKSFVDGDRTDASQIAERLGGDGALFLVVDEPASPADLAGAVYVQVSGARGYFGMLAVDPARQGSGLGRVLVEAAEAHCRGAGCYFVDIHVVNVRSELPAFYARFGFAPVDVGPFHSVSPLKQPVHVVKMTKPLVPLFSAVSLGVDAKG